MGEGVSQTVQGSPLHQLHQALRVHKEDLPLSLLLQRGRVGVQHIGDLHGEGTGSSAAWGQHGCRAASSLACLGTVLLYAEPFVCCGGFFPPR